VTLLKSVPRCICTCKSFQRHDVDDQRRAFGAEPGRLVGTRMMADTDNTGESVEACYGDLLKRACRDEVVATSADRGSVAGLFAP